MGKRTRSDSNDYECIAKKFKKLERKLLRARRKHRDRQPRQRSSSSSSDTSSSSSSSSSSSASSRPHSPRASCSSRQEPYNNEDVPAIEYMNYTSTSAPDQPSVSTAAPGHPAPEAAAPTRAAGTSAAAPAQPRASTSRTADVQTQSALSTPPINSQPVLDPLEAPELDEEILKILGDNPSQTKVYGKDIRPDLAVRFQHIATSGLSKESRKELLQRYLPPANSTLIDAPTLNPEIKAAIHEHVFKRDKCIEIKQKQVASAISCLGECLTLLLSEQPKGSNTAVIQLLMDAGKILCDCQNAESLVRRSFVLHNLKKGLKEEIQTTKIDKYLFSQDLADKLKAAKAINKSGDDLKVAPSIPQQKKSIKPPAKNLNWRGPPLTQRPKGTQRTKVPAQKNRRYNSSRQSSRPASTRNSRH